MNVICASLSMCHFHIAERIVSFCNFHNLKLRSLLIRVVFAVRVLLCDFPQRTASLLNSFIFHKLYNVSYNYYPLSNELWVNTIINSLVFMIYKSCQPNVVLYTFIPVTNCCQPWLPCLTVTTLVANSDIHVQLIVSIISWLSHLSVTILLRLSVLPFIILLNIF